MVLKIIGIGISGAVLSMMVKQHRPELAMAVPILTAAAILMMCVPYIASLIGMFEHIADESGLNTSHLKIVMKIIGVAYICQFAADVCKDAGENSISGKIVLGGKLLIITLSMPIIYDLLDLVTNIINI